MFKKVLSDIKSKKEKFEDKILVKEYKNKTLIQNINCCIYLIANKPIKTRNYFVLE